MPLIDDLLDHVQLRGNVPEKLLFALKNILEFYFQICVCTLNVNKKNFLERYQHRLHFQSGAIQVLRNADGGGVKSYGRNRYEGVRFNVISVTRGWVGVQFPGKKRYVTLEWPLWIYWSVSLCVQQATSSLSVFLQSCVLSGNDSSIYGITSAILPILSFIAVT